MRKVQSAPQLTALFPSPGMCGASKVKPKKGIHSPCLPTRTKTKALLLDTVDSAVFSKFDELKEEVVLESETNTVGVAAGYCFAEFGGVHLREAPELSDGLENELSEEERELAACLATPFEGNPAEEALLRERVLLIYEKSEFMYFEIEKKHERALALNRGRRSLFWISIGIKINQTRLVVASIVRSAKRTMVDL